MSMIKLLTEGGWWLKSESDPRWNCSGSSDSVGGFVMPPECKQKFEDLKKELGEPPEDLKYGYMKY